MPTTDNGLCPVKKQCYGLGDSCIASINNEERYDAIFTVWRIYDQVKYLNTNTNLKRIQFRKLRKRRICSTNYISNEREMY